MTEEEHLEKLERQLPIIFKWMELRLLKAMLAQRGKG